MVPFLLIKPFIPAYNTSPSRSSSHLSHAQFSNSNYTQDESHIMQPVMQQQGITYLRIKAILMRSRTIYEITDCNADAICCLKGDSIMSLGNCSRAKNSCSYSPVKELKGFKNNQINKGLFVQQSKK